MTDATRTSTFASLSVRNFRLFFAGQFVSQVGNWLTLVAQTLLVLQLTGSGVAVGLLVACQFLPVLLAGAWAGLVADRSDKRRLLLRVQTAAMVQSFALGALAFADRPPLVLFYVVALFGGVCTAFDNPARRSFVVEMVPDHLVNNAVSLNSALMTASRVFGPALAGLLSQTVGFGWCFTLDGLSYAAVLVALARMRPDEIRRAEPTPRAAGQVREGLRYVLGVPELRIPLVMMTVVGTLTFNFSVVLPLFVTRSLGGSDTTFTLVFSVLSAGSMIGALLSARRQTVTPHHVVASSAAFGVAMAAFGAAPTVATAYPLALGVGMTSIVFMTSSTSIVQVTAAPSMRGRVLALQAMVFLGSTPLGGPLLGWICDHDPRAGVAVGAGAALAAAAWGHLALSRARHDAETRTGRPLAGRPV